MIPPQRAADIANYFVEMLNKIYLELSISEAMNNRIFLEDRYNKNLEDLKNAEDNIGNSKRNMVCIRYQTK